MAFRTTGLRLTGALALLAFGLAVLWVLRPQSATGPAGIGPDDPTQVALGEKLYARHCASCHGANRQGQPDWQQRRADGKLPAPPQDESGHSWHHSDDVLFRLTRDGLASFAGSDYATDMPAFKGKLDDAEIAAIIAFIKSRWPANIRQVQDQLNKAK